MLVLSLLSSDYCLSMSYLLFAIVFLHKTDSRSLSAITGCRLDSFLNMFEGV